MEPIVVYPTSDAEMRLAKLCLQNLRGGEGVLTGLADEVAMETLRSAGLLFERLGATQRMPEPHRPEPFAAHSEGKGKSAAKSLPETLRAFRADVPHPYLLVLDGPLFPEMAQDLAARSVDLGEYVPDFSYVAHLLPTQRDSLEALGFVTEIRELPASPLHRRNRNGESLIKADDLELFDVVLYEHADPKLVKAAITEGGGYVYAMARRKIRASLSDDQIDTLRQRADVKIVQEYVDPQLFNDRAQTLSGLRSTSGPAPHGLTGKGQMVGIADTGLDGSHRDFADRIVHCAPLGWEGSGHDQHGHGSHVAGSIAGDGNSSNSVYRGVAYEAEIYFQCIQYGSRLTPPVDLQDMLGPAYEAGVRVHNNSWGWREESYYRESSGEVDMFVAAHPDMVVVIAAGNEGALDGAKNQIAGYTIAAPATAKNAITVGASQSDRTTGGHAARTYGEVWKNRFHTGHHANTKISGNPDIVSALSSRGPSDRGRIKPDLVAPGTDVISVHAAGTKSHWGQVEGNAHYSYMGGTSMAAPQVAGAAVLVRQYLKDMRQINLPSAALIKAILVNGSTALPPGPENGVGFPNYHQGFGRLDLAGALPGPDGTRLAIVDTWTKVDGKLPETRRFHRYFIDLDKDGPLRLCLAWSDLPGTYVQNAMAVVLTCPDGAKHVGNKHFPDRDPDRPYDTGNNVQIIRLDHCPAGQYVIQVTALNLKPGGQDYALVARGHIGNETFVVI